MSFMHIAQKNTLCWKNSSRRNEKNTVWQSAVVQTLQRPLHL